MSGHLVIGVTAEAEDVRVDVLVSEVWVEDHHNGAQVQRTY